MTADKLNRIRESLNILKLKTIAGVLDDELARAAQEETPTTELLEQLFTLEADGLIQRRIEQQDAYNANLFHKVIDGRYCKKSTMITTNIDFKELGDYLGDPVITTAIVDCMVHHSIIINIQGPILAPA